MSDLINGISFLAQYNNIKIKNAFNFNTFRALMNVTMPINLPDFYYEVQNRIIAAERKEIKIAQLNDISYVFNNIYLYNGDITNLSADVIVNACNSRLLGCFNPLHNCVDNIIHSYAGLQVRRDLLAMVGIKHIEPNGLCKVTKGYNLPAKYIFHTVGPCIVNSVTKKDEIDLENCYLSCLKKAIEYNAKSIAFPCISTGVYNFPNDLASQIAIKVVTDFLKKHHNLKVIFVTYKNIDFNLYSKYLKRNELNDRYKKNNKPI